MLLIAVVGTILGLVGLAYGRCGVRRAARALLLSGAAVVAVVALIAAGLAGWGLVALDRAVARQEVERVAAVAELPCDSRGEYNWVTLNRWVKLYEGMKPAERAAYEIKCPVRDILFD